jgi:hypothetical protein
MQAIFTFGGKDQVCTGTNGSGNRAVEPEILSK